MAGRKGGGFQNGHFGRQPERADPARSGVRTQGSRPTQGTGHDACRGGGKKRAWPQLRQRDRAGHGVPSIASLLKLCRAHGLGLRDQYDEKPSALIRREERRQVDLGGHGFIDYALTPRNSKHMLATWTELAPGASAGDDFYSLDADEELILVLRGSITVHFEDGSIEMLEGDALTLDPRRKRLLVNPLQDQTTIALMVYVPPPL